MVSGDIHGYFVQDKVRPHPSEAKSCVGSRFAEHSSPSIFDAKSLRILATATHRHNNKVNVSWRRLLRFVTTDHRIHCKIKQGQLKSVFHLVRSNYIFQD